MTKRAALVRLGIFLVGVVMSGMLATQTANACFMRSPQPVQVWLDHIKVEIRNQVAVKTYNCTFKNPNPQAVVGGECYMELEPGAQVDDMSVWVEGQEMKAEILDVDKAKSVFTEIVKNGGSPALLEYFGNQLITTKVPRIAAGGTVSVKLQYTTLLKKKGGLVRLQMLNTNPKALMQPLKSASVTIKIQSDDPLKNIYSPTHQIKIEEDKDWDVVVKWAKEDYLPKHPFVLYYDTDAQKVGANVIAYRDLDEEGAFMLMLSPTVGNGKGQVREEDILPKDVVFCVDTSGSMLQGGKMEQARKALKYCLENLRAGDRFNIVDFSTVARSFHDKGLVGVNDNTRKKALRYADNLAPRGGTAIQESLSLSLKHLGKSERLKMIVFATDGLPTIGERDPEAILKSMLKENTEDVRMFVFGEGYDVNTKLLDFLAINHRGESDYILPEEDIAAKISGFFDRVGSPIMTNVEIEFGGLEVTDVFPRQIKDIYRGEQIVVYGRYSGHGEQAVKVTGSVNGKRQAFEYKMPFPEYSEDDKNSFVPRLWAGKKVDFLLSEIRKTPSNPPKALVDEVTYLAKRYGIITPYTSYLMTDDIARNDVPGNPADKLAWRARALGGGGGNFGAALPEPNAVPKAQFESAEETKQSIVVASKKLAELRRKSDQSGAANAFDNAAEYFSDAKDGKPQSSLKALRYIGTLAFFHSNGVWYDSRYQAGTTKVEKTVKIGSQDYIDLLLKDGKLAKYLALGDVVLKVGETWYRFEK